MNVLSAHLNFFGIEECGLYKQGNKAPKALEAEEAFDLIYKWVQGKPMEDTIPWDPSSTKSGAAKCYCHDYYKCESTGEYLFVLWKSESDSAGAIWGAQASAVAGQSDVVEFKDNYKGRKMIWGRPCYYWIIPKLKTVVSIKVDHSVCDSGLFQEWVSKCITNRVHHAKKLRTETDTGQVRFEFVEPVTSQGTRYSFRFNVHLRSLSTGSTELQSLATRVTHIVRRDTIKLNAGIDDRPTWIKLFDKIPHLPARPKANSRQIEIRAEAKPTVKEIREIIEKFAREERKRSDWNNVGFATDTGIVWADKYRLHENVIFNNAAATVLAAADIHARLAKLRDQLLKGVLADEKNRAKSRRIAGGSIE